MKKPKLPKDCGAKQLEDEAEYEGRLEAAQMRLLSIQQAYLLQKRRAVIVMEGDDAAGKGGAISRMTLKLDPRFCKVWPIGAPTDSERAHPWLARFWPKLPETGTIAVFDRSWYGRVLVERAEGLIPKQAWQRAYDEIDAFEQLLLDEGIRLVKLYLVVSPDEQARRLIERLEEPLKRWKIGPRDFEARRFHKEYRNAAKAMLKRTHTEAAPWQVVPADHKWYARVAVLEHVAERLADGVDLAPPPPDPELLRLAAEMRKQ